MNTGSTVTVKKALLGRLLLIAFAIIIQFIWLVWLVQHLSRQTSYFLPLIELVIILTLLTVINRKINPAYKLIWTVLILTLPIVGLTLYGVFGHSWWACNTRKKLAKSHGALIQHLPKDPQLEQNLRDLSPSAANQSSYISKCSDYPLYQNTSSKYYPSGEAIFEEMLREMENAEHFIFLEFFIISQGALLERLLTILKNKVDQGVDVRLIYDDAGSITTIHKNFYQEVEQMGIRCVKFNPMKPILSLTMNNRDHRKIVVIDGYIGYTGGMNVGDEYTNEIERLGYWKDTGIRLEGDAVWSLTSMFLEMWNYNTGTEDCYEDYKPKQYQKTNIQSDGYVQPYGDSPLDDENVSSTVYMNIIGQAEDYIYIFTPYLILDHEMIIYLQNAAKRGVDVRIVLPDIPDKKVVFLMSQSYYQWLLEAGVKIYQYIPGFMHAKSFLCDDKIATVGTVNMDFRSLYLHFECGIWMYQTSNIKEIKADYQDVFEHSKTIDLLFCEHFSLSRKVFQNILRLFAPLV